MTLVAIVEANATPATVAMHLLALVRQILSDLTATALDEEADR